MSESPSHKVILPAVCWNDSLPEFYAVTDDVSARGIRLRAAVIPVVGEQLMCSIRHVGPVAAAVQACEARAFTVQLKLRRERCIEVVRTLLDYARRQQPAFGGAQRVHPRVVPRQAGVTVVLPDGTPVAGHLIDLSASGAAIQLEHPLAVGAIVKVGALTASVVRTFREGVGVIFHDPFGPETVSADTVL